MIGVLAGDEPEILYVDVIDSDAPIRFTLAAGDRRPLYCAASGKAVLAFRPTHEQDGYIRETAFTAFTPQTTRKPEMAGQLREIRETAVAFDNGGKVTGASGIASPIFDSEGRAFASISVAGPSERIDAHRVRLEALVRSAGERISRLVGYTGGYPPAG
jgi:DNA-binding IclR family transcriptional regulator